ncbi:CAP domain-containing protein [Singulisphaera sp. PoT]|uniref:CAP domain-containing protein n=1 Tax=Singulisphaera sp. PoT TaxID=3411797 RepID=UPI003BF53A8B
MRSTTWILTAMFALAATTLLASSTFADQNEGPEKQWVWLEKQGVWGYGYQIKEGPHAGLWRVDPDSKRPPEAPADPYGFAAILNSYRASAGLAPLSYEPDLAGWAAQNNAEQANRGLGHHVNPNCLQNCAWNTPDANSVASAWMESPGHRANMLNPSASRFGIAFGPGPYWTMNAQ